MMPPFAQGRADARGGRLAADLPAFLRWARLAGVRRDYEDWRSYRVAFVRELAAVAYRLTGGPDSGLDSPKIETKG